MRDSSEDPRLRVPSPIPRRRSPEDIEHRALMELGEAGLENEQLVRDYLRDEEDFF